MHVRALGLLPRGCLLVVALGATACDRPGSASSHADVPRTTVDVSTAPRSKATSAKRSSSSAEPAARPAGAPATLRVYVSGESIEERNRFTDPPFDAEGGLFDLGERNNDNEQYGWMVPMAERLKLRDPSLHLSFVGDSVWTGADDEPYSGTYPSTEAAHTSAIAGTDIVSWLDNGSTERSFAPRRLELSARRHCYDVAFAARGGNDLNQEMSDEDFAVALRRLVLLLAHGSSCHPAVPVYVTAHMPDRQDVAAQEHAFRERTSALVTELRKDEQVPAEVRAHLHFVDVFGAFRANKPTTSMPSPSWFARGRFDTQTIGRRGDALHPRRLASIYAGEVVADALDLGELHASISSPAPKHPAR